MSLDIGAALRDGFSRTTERNALVLWVAFFVVALASAAASQTLTVEVAQAAADLSAEQGQQRPPEFDPDRMATQSPFALPLSLPAAALLAFLLALVSEAVSIVAVRTFVSDETRTVPAEFRRRRLGRATLNGFVGGVFVWALVAVGLLALVVPGVFLYVAFFFLRPVIAVEDRNFVAAMARSWRLTRGSRLRLFALAVVLLVVALVAMVPAMGLGTVAPAAGGALTAATSSLVAVFGVAVTARAYVQLLEAYEAEPEEGVGALGPDDIPAPE